MKKYIIANWKMNPATREEAEILARSTDVSGLIMAPPFPFLEIVSSVIKNATLGAQDLFWSNPSGAFTGEVSASELKSFGVKYVVIGHSERRANLGETNEMIARKIKTAFESGLTPILCVGESKDERLAEKTEEVVARELRAGLSMIDFASIDLKDNKLIIAYEPIWAIGSGTPDTPQNMLNMVNYIKRICGELSAKLLNNLYVIYGGSINSLNVMDFLKYDEIDGVLVGGASLKKEEIIKIVENSQGL